MKTILSLLVAACASVSARSLQNEVLNQITLVDRETGCAQVCTFQQCDLSPDCMRMICEENDCNGEQCMLIWSDSDGSHESYCDENENENEKNVVGQIIDQAK